MSALVIRGSNLKKDSRTTVFFTHLLANGGEQVLSQGRSRSADTSKKSSSKMVVKSEEIEKFMSEGGEPMLTLPDGRVVMRTI